MSGVAEARRLRQLIEEVQIGKDPTPFKYNRKKTITLLTESTPVTGLASRLGVNRLDTKPTTTGRSRNRKSDCCRESSRHLHQKIACAYTTKALEGTWTSCTHRRRGEHVLHQ